MNQADKREWTGPRPGPNFVMIPKFVRQEILPNLTGSEFQVLYLLMDEAYGRQQPYAMVTLRMIERECAIARTTARRALHRLCELRYIEPYELAPVGSHETSVYRLLLTEDPRYTHGSRGSAALHERGSEMRHDRVALRYRRPPVSSDLYKERGERDTPPRNKYTGGRYGVCPTCSSRPCVCGK